MSKITFYINFTTLEKVGSAINTPPLSETLSIHYDTYSDQISNSITLSEDIILNIGTFVVECEPSIHKDSLLICSNKVCNYLNGFLNHYHLRLNESCHNIELGGERINKADMNLILAKNMTVSL